MDEAELAAGRVQVGEASVLWHIEVDIEVDIEASEGPDVAAFAASVRLGHSSDGWVWIAVMMGWDVGIGIPHGTRLT